MNFLEFAKKYKDVQVFYDFVNWQVKIYNSNTAKEWARHKLDNQWMTEEEYFKELLYITSSNCGGMNWILYTIHGVIMRGPNELI